jgi:ComF family protein
MLQYFFTQALAFFRNVLSPPQCAFCLKKMYERRIFCDVCGSKVHSVAPYKLNITSTKYVWVHAVSLYDDPMKKLIHQKRYGNVLGSYALAELVWHKTVFRQLACDIIVPIPLHWTRRMVRGFNQAHEMGYVLAKKRGVCCVPLLTRVHRTAYQSDLAVSERECNVKKAFQLNAEMDRYKGRDIVIVDDLLTTGSTIKYAAKQLFLLKPRSISVIVACRTRV